jgi:hypothetical protein
MLRDGKIQLGEFNLSVAADKPPAAYSQLSSDVALPNLKWIDGHKPVFRVNVSMVSSIHPKVRGQPSHKIPFGLWDRYSPVETPVCLPYTHLRIHHLILPLPVNIWIHSIFTVHVGHSPS